MFIEVYMSKMLIYVCPSLAICTWYAHQLQELPGESLFQIVYRYHFKTKQNICSELTEKEGEHGL